MDLNIMFSTLFYTLYNIILIYGSVFSIIKFVFLQAEEEILGCLPLDL